MSTSPRPTPTRFASPLLRSALALLAMATAGTIGQGCSSGSSGKFFPPPPPPPPGPGTVAFTLGGSATTDEASGAPGLTVTLTLAAGSLASPVTVDVSDAGGGTATSGTDYTTIAPTTLTFPAGSANGATQTFTVPVLQDAALEGNETVNLSLANVTGAATLGAQTTHTVTITDDEKPITTVAGNGVGGFSGDGGAATAAQLNNPQGVVVDAVGDLLIADGTNDRIRRVDGMTGVITTIAGNGVGGFSGDGGAATAAQLNQPNDVVLDAAGNLFIADTNNSRIRRVDAGTGVITTVAGDGTAGFGGDGGLATAAQLNQPIGLALDASSNLFIADQVNQRIRRVDAVTGVITTVAGIGTAAFSGDGGLATAAELSFPFDVAFDSASNMFIADLINQRVRRVDAVTGVITTVAGTGTAGFNGDGGAATAAQLNNPASLAFDAGNNLLIADRDNQRIRRVGSGTGTITTVAGDGSAGFSGDGGVATAAQLNFPSGVAIDAAGGLYVGDRANHRVRLVGP